MKKILQFILAILARMTLKRYKPTVIGITGSVGKTSTKEAIFSVLRKKYAVRAPEKNFNNEIGLPLTILGRSYYGKNVFGWLAAFLGAVMKIIIRDRNYPEILILEYGIDKPGDMDYLVAIARPKIAIVTAVGDVPVHVEFFEDAEGVVKEKAKIIKALPQDGCAILNHDDYAVYDMKSKTKARVLTFGVEEHADIKITNYQLLSAKDGEVGDVPAGISFKIEHAGNLVPIRLQNVFGLPQTYAAAAAAAVGVFLGMNLVEVAEALKDFMPPPGRLRLIKGVKNSFILDDSYNAAPEAMLAAIAALKELPAKRKIAVLGDMLEIGRYSEQVHRAVGDKVAEFVDLLFVVGPRAKFIADEAMTRGIEKGGRVLQPDQVFEFDDSINAADILEPLIKEGDLILVKGSQALRMERVVEGIMAHPDKASELLVRQDEHWKK